MTVHGTLAAFLSIEELALTDETEAQAYSDVLKEYLRIHHPNAMDEKKLATFNLLVFGAGFYGTRIMAYRNRRAEEKSKSPRKLEVVKPQVVPEQRVNGEAKEPTGLRPADLWGGFPPTVTESSGEG